MKLTLISPARNGHCSEHVKLCFSVFLTHIWVGRRIVVAALATEKHAVAGSVVVVGQQLAGAGSHHRFPDALHFCSVLGGARVTIQTKIGVKVLVRIKDGRVRYAEAIRKCYTHLLQFFENLIRSHPRF
jgi:hypothetical protein